MMGKDRKLQGSKNKPIKRKKSPGKQQEPSKKAKNDILQLFQKQKNKLSISEIVISDDSSDFVIQDVKKKRTSTRSRAGLVEKTNLPIDVSSPKADDPSCSWLSAAEVISKENSSGVDSDAEQPAEMRPLVEGNLKSEESTLVLDPDLRPCTPVLFDSDSDSVEVATVDSKHTSSSTKHCETETNLQVCIDPYSLLLASFSDSDDFSGAPGSLAKTNGDIQNTHITLTAGASSVQALKSETRRTEEQNVNSSPKVVVLDGIKKQSTITSFFGGKTSKPVLTFVQDVHTAVKAKEAVQKMEAIGEVLEKDADAEKWNNVTTRACPFYKKIPGTNFAVDAFSYGVIPGIEYYFLSHFHSDHYQGLNKHFRKPIFCTQATANLVVLKLRVNRSYLRVLQLNIATNVSGIEVTPVEANHCPGAAMFVFHFPQSGRRILHTGDFRFHHSMTSYKPLQFRFDQLFLDTTYLNPSYNFPPQDDIICFVRDVVAKEAKGKPRVLVVTGSYTIGKEKVFMAAAEILDCLVWTSMEKQRVLNCLDDQAVKKRLTQQPSQARVHVLPMQRIGHSQLSSYLNSHRSCFDQILAFKPTGWTHAQGKTNTDFTPSIQGAVSIYSVPYSEHSSFTELEKFVKFICPRKVTPTVNVGSQSSRNRMDSYIQSWLREARR